LGWWWRCFVVASALAGAIALWGSAAQTGSAESAVQGVTLTVTVPNSLLTWRTDCGHGSRACVESQALSSVVVQVPGSPARAIIANALPGLHAFALGDQREQATFTASN